MGRTSDWMRYQDRVRVNRRRMGRSRRAVYARRYYWVAKLRRLGVPEPDVRSAVDGIMRSRLSQPYRRENRDRILKASADWYRRNKAHALANMNRSRLRRRADDAARRNFLLRAMTKGE